MNKNAVGSRFVLIAVEQRLAIVVQLLAELIDLIVPVHVEVSIVSVVVSVGVHCILVGIVFVRGAFATYVIHQHKADMLLLLLLLLLVVFVFDNIGEIGLAAGGQLFHQLVEFVDLAGAVVVGTLAAAFQHVEEMLLVVVQHSVFIISINTTIVAVVVVAHSGKVEMLLLS